MHSTVVVTAFIRTTNCISWYMQRIKKNCNLSSKHLLQVKGWNSSRTSVPRTYVLSLGSWPTNCKVVVVVVVVIVVTVVTVVTVVVVAVVVVVVVVFVVVVVVAAAAVVIVIRL